MNEDKPTQYQRFSRNCKWQWLTYRVAEENRWESVRLSIEALRQFSGFRLSPELRKVLKLK